MANEKHPSYRITNKDDKEAKLHPLDKTVTQTGTCTTDDRRHLTWSESPQEPPRHVVQ